MISANELRFGTKILLEGNIFSVTDFQHVKPGKGGAFMRTKLKNIKTGAVIDRTFRSEEKLTPAKLEERKVQFLYESGGHYTFMDVENYEQLTLNLEHLGESKNYLKENLTLDVLLHDQEPMGVNLPIFVELEIAQTDPGVRGDTASGGSKPATLETGAIVSVPLFLNIGDIIKVDTRTGAYVERVKAG